MANKAEINTVNVLEVTNGDIQSIRSFQENAEGNTEAETLFAKILKNCNVEPDDIDSYIEDGSYSDDNGYEVFIIHSS
jgi:hypothetical protein